MPPRQIFQENDPRLDQMDALFTDIMSKEPPWHHCGHIIVLVAHNKETDDREVAVMGSENFSPPEALESLSIAGAQLVAEIFGLDDDND